MGGSRFPGIHPASVRLQQLLPIQEYKLRRDLLALTLIGLHDSFQLPFLSWIQFNPGCLRTQ
ncbi:hypothetical protein D3C86_2063190 [compost metagenome]